MTATEVGQDEGRELQLQRAIAAYLEARDAGQAPNADQWAADHPELSPELGQFFDDLEALDRKLPELRDQPDESLERTAAGRA